MTENKFLTMFGGGGGTSRRAAGGRRAVARPANVPARGQGRANPSILQRIGNRIRATFGRRG